VFIFSKIGEMGELKKYVIIVAAGKGLRMGKDTPKQFLELCGKPLLYHTVQAFTDSFADLEVVLVLSEPYLDVAEAIRREHPARAIHAVVGGETRFHSVQNGLKVVTDDSIVFVHDGARPLVSNALIRRCYSQALDLGSAIPAITVADSMRCVDTDNISYPVDRSAYRIIQTPQTFRSEIICPAYEQTYLPAFTDEATVVEAYGTPVHLVEGERRNIKVTVPDDLTIAAALSHR
jgi:2-C-methyl-D-erythritol 4-phosphate cytidylyltransferase